MATHYSTIRNYNNNNKHILINSSLQEELERLPPFSPKCCIYRVPRHLQMANEGAYTPLVVSIGPLHHHDGHLQATEIHKLKYLQSFLKRSQINGHELGDFLEIVRNHYSDICEYYADPMVAEVDREELIKTVLVDSAFLIELFSRGCDRDLIKQDDQMFNRPRMVVEVSHDICLEENQLPLFILCELYNAAGFNQGNRNLDFIDIACSFLGIKKKPDPHITYNHLVDLLRFDLLPSKLRGPGPNDTKPDEVQIYADQSSPIETNAVQISTDQSSSGCIAWEIPRSISSIFRKEESCSEIKPNNIVCKTATALREAGVRFIKADKTHQLDIEFNRNEGTLSIPAIVVQDDTEARLRNLAVFEQCHYFDDSYIIDYISFLDFLINTPEDVTLLVKEGIIENWLGSDERVADLFNGLNKHLKIRAGSFYYAKQSKELDEYYNRTWNRHRAVLRHKYFNHPWATISVVYAVVLLLLTVLQAATGVISAFPSKN